MKVRTQRPGEASPLPGSSREHLNLRNYRELFTNVIPDGRRQVIEELTTRLDAPWAVVALPDIPVAEPAGRPRSHRHHQTEPGRLTMFTSILRTVVPALWGAFIGWAIGVFADP